MSLSQRLKELSIAIQVPKQILTLIETRSSHNKTKKTRYIMIVIQNLMFIK